VNAAADHRAQAAVIGLGKIGLPLAVQIARHRGGVIGVDISSAVVESVNAGRSPVLGEPGLDDGLASAIASGSMVATTDVHAAVASSSFVIVVVPLVVDESGNPLFAGIDAATRAIAEGVRPGTTVIYETTLPVGTTRDRFGTLLEETSGLTVGTDLFVVHSPERVSSGTVFRDLARYPKLVGGTDSESSRRAVAFYESFLKFEDRPELERANGVWELESCEAAELAKLAETSYRDLNIAFANQLARGAEALGLDIGPVIDACNSQPYSHIHRPGIAVGGHCIPVYPHFLSRSVPQMTLSDVGREVNALAPALAADRLCDELGGLSGRSVVILGLAYRGGVKEHAFSGTLSLVPALTSLGARVTVMDPLYSDREIEAHGLDPHAAGSSVDAVVLQADHAQFQELGPGDFPGVQLVFDGRRALDPGRWEPVRVVGPGFG